MKNRQHLQQPFAWSHYHINTPRCVCVDAASAASPFSSPLLRFTEIESEREDGGSSSVDLSQAVVFESSSGRCPPPTYPRGAGLKGNKHTALLHCVHWSVPPWSDHLTWDRALDPKHSPSPKALVHKGSTPPPLFFGAPRLMYLMLTLTSKFVQLLKQTW